MTKWKIKDCDCRWCRYRPLKTRRQIASVLAMQLYRHAGKRLAKVFRQLDQMLLLRRKKGDALYIMRDFTRTCIKWGNFLEYVEVTGLCFGDNYQMRQVVLKMISLADKLNGSGGDYQIASTICREAVDINARISPLLERGQIELEKIEATLLIKSMRKLVRLRNTYTNSDHRYFEDEVPEFGPNYAQENETGLVLYFDEVDIANEPLDLLTRIAASRLLRMYGSLFEKIKRLGQQDMFSSQMQARMDIGCQIVDRCLYGGKENKDADPQRTTRQSGPSESGLCQERAEPGSAAARERGAA